MEVQVLSRAPFFQGNSQSSSSAHTVRTDSEQKLRFPRLIKHQGHTAKIYDRRASYPYYRAVWWADGVRVMRSYRTYGEAESEAKSALGKIRKGVSYLATLEGNSIDQAEAAIKELHHAGITNVLGAVRDYIAAKAILGQVSLKEAAETHIRITGSVKVVTFRQAAKDYIANLDRRSLSVAYCEKEEKRADRLALCFPCDLGDIMPEDVEKVFEATFGDLSPKSRNHLRGTLRCILKFALARRYLTRSHPLGEAVDENAPSKALRPEKNTTAAPQILVPEQLAGLLHTAGNELLPVLALAAFTGARREELLRLTWEDVWRREGYVELCAEKTKTRQRRLVPFCAALTAWLAPYRQAVGAIWRGSKGTFNHAFEDTKGLCGVKGKNLLRHSYASYRLALIKDTAEVALELGNSPQMIFQHYRELVTPEQAQAWFAILPKAEAKNILAMG